MRNDSFSRRVLMLFLSNLTLYLLGFCYRAALSRLVPASALGLESLVMQVYGVVYAVCIPGLFAAVSGMAAAGSARELRPLVMASLKVLAAVWAIAAAVIALRGRPLCRSFFREEGVYPALWPMLFCILLTGIENVLKAVHLGAKKVGVCAASELVEQTVRMALAILLLNALYDGTDTNAVLLITLGMVISELVSVGILTASFLKRFGGEPRGADPLIRPIAEAAFPISVNAVLSTLFGSAGALLLPGRLMQYGMTYSEALSEIGMLSAVCIPLTMLPMTYAGALSKNLLPEVSSITASGGDPHPFIRRAFLRSAPVFAAASVLLFCFSGSIASLLFGERVFCPAFPLLFVRAFAAFIHLLAVSALNGIHEQKTVLYLGFSGEAYQLILILVLTPVLGVWGYAAGLAAGEVLRALAELAALASKRKKGMEFSRRIC